MSPSQERRYFAFGSNMDPDQMREPGVAFQDIKRALLRDYRLAFNYRSARYNAGVADVVPLPASVVEGVLYRISEEDLKTLDKYEGVATGRYRREEGMVEDGNGRRHPAVCAVCYEVVQKSDSFIPPQSPVYGQADQRGRGPPAEPELYGGAPRHSGRRRG